MLYKLDRTFQAVDETANCDYSNENCGAAAFVAVLRFHTILQIETKGFSFSVGSVKTFAV